MRAVEAELREIPACACVLSTVGGGFFERVNRPKCYVRLAPHEERVFSLTRLLEGLVTRIPVAAFHGNYIQRGSDAEIRARARKFTDLRLSVRNMQSFNIGGGQLRHRLRHPRARTRGAAEYAEKLRDRAPSWASSTPTPR